MLSQSQHHLEARTIALHGEHTQFKPLLMLSNMNLAFSFVPTFTKSIEKLCGSVHLFGKGKRFGADRHFNVTNSTR